MSLLGARFGRLTIIDFERVDRHRNSYYLCECDCGNVKSVALRHLKSGSIQSCTCLNKEINRSIKTTHGMHGTTEYRSWNMMLQRCSNPNYTQYNDYGGRGIKICKKWVKFSNFLNDMGHKPSPEYTIERIDNEKGYSPSNCKWATRQEQNLNTRRTIR